MTEFPIWLGLLLLVVAGVAATRFNPLVVYSRVTLFRLAVLTIVVVGVILMAGFVGTPLIAPSGVFNPNGG